MVQNDRFSNDQFFDLTGIGVTRNRVQNNEKYDEVQGSGATAGVKLYSICCSVVVEYVLAVGIQQLRDSDDSFVIIHIVVTVLSS
jgi:hypothetical protein